MGVLAWVAGHAAVRGQEEAGDLWRETELLGEKS